MIFYTQVLDFVTQYTLYSGCLIFVTGLVGNAMNMLVFSQLKLFRTNRSAFYLISESISSFLFHFIFMTLTILTAIYGDDGTGRFPVWCKLRYILGPTFAVVTYYMICSVTVDEYLSTNHRPYLRQMCTVKSTHYVSIIIVLIAIVHSVVLGLFFNIRQSVGCVISNPTFVQYTTVFYYPILIGFLPIVIASLFSYLAYRNVRRIVRQQLPIILIRVLCFISLASPYNICRIYVTLYPISKTDMMRYVIVRLIQAITFSMSTANYTVRYSEVNCMCDVVRYVCR